MTLVLFLLIWWGGEISSLPIWIKVGLTIVVWADSWTYLTRRRP